MNVFILAVNWYTKPPMIISLFLCLEYFYGMWLYLLVQGGGCINHAHICRVTYLFCDISCCNVCSSLIFVYEVLIKLMHYWQGTEACIFLLKIQKLFSYQNNLNNFILLLFQLLDANYSPFWSNIYLKNISECCLCYNVFLWMLLLSPCHCSWL